MTFVALHPKTETRRTNPVAQPLSRRHAHLLVHSKDFGNSGGARYSNHWNCFTTAAPWKRRAKGLSGTGGASWLRKQTTAAALLVFATGCLIAIAPGARAQTSSAPATQSDSSNLPSAPQPTSGSDNSGTSIGGSTGGGSPIQLSTQSSLFNAYLGSVQAQPVVAREIPLTLDDALSLGLRNNLGAIYSLQAEQLTAAQRQQVLNVLLPNVDIQGGTAFHQFNLQAFGFTSSALAGFGSLIPPGQSIFHHREGGCDTGAGEPVAVSLQLVWI